MADRLLRKQLLVGLFENGFSLCFCLGLFNLLSRQHPDLMFDGYRRRESDLSSKPETAHWGLLRLKPYMGVTEGSSQVASPIEAG
jgi:hypothetical protein